MGESTQPSQSAFRANACALLDPTLAATVLLLREDVAVYSSPSPLCPMQRRRSIDLKNILTGKHGHVLEQSASRMLRAGDVTFTRVVTADGFPASGATMPTARSPNLDESQ
jgi:hypothetical protein